MRYAWLVPLFVRQTPIGVLWGIRNSTVTGPQSRQVLWKLQTLCEGVSNIISYELDHDRVCSYRRSRWWPKSRTTTSRPCCAGR